MFKNRAIQMRFVKTAEDDQAAPILPEIPTLDPEQINTLLKDQVQNLGKTIVAVAGALTLMATAREIIVNNTNPALRH